MDVVRLATQLVEDLEREEVSKVWDRLDDTLRTTVETDELRRWNPGLDNWIGSPRRLGEAPDGSDPAVGRVVVDGPRGRLAVDVRVDGQGRVSRVDLSPLVTDGIRNIVIGCPRGSWNEEAQRVEGEPRQLGEFYAALLGMTIIRDDWIKAGTDAASYPHLAFGDGWSDERPPRWPDPEYPAQLHLDIFTADLDALGARAAELGAVRLQDGDGHRIFADPFGHPFCGYVDIDVPEGTVGRLGRVVFDCEDPSGLAAFYAELLDMPVRVEESPERVVIARRDGALPNLAFQRVEQYVPPRWHDDAYPEQIHLDLHFNDHAAAVTSAERLGATLLPPPRGSCPVYADPAGHPFCLCSNGGGPEHLVVKYLPRG